MNILIYGTGAVGTFLSTLIYEKNNNCILFSRGSKFELFRNSGITLSTNLKEHETIYPDLFDTNKIIKLSDLPFIPDLIIYCVKSYHNDDSINILKKIFQNTKTYILTLQNGFQSTVKLSNFFGDKILTGAAYIDSVLDDNGKVFETGGDPKIVIGSLYDNGKSLMQDFKDLFNTKELNIEISNDIKSVIWRKLMYICALSGIMCLYRQPLINILSDKKGRDILMEIITETYNVANEDNAVISKDEINNVFYELDTNRENSISSMYEDLKKTNPIEVDALNTYVSNTAKKYQINTPMNDFISTILETYMLYR